MKQLEHALRLVEYTAIPLTVLMLIYVLSGYGMVSAVPSYLGLTYSVSSRLHTLPLLRYITAVLVAVHAYCGLVIVAYRRVRSRLLRGAVVYAGLAYAILVISVATASELSKILP